MLLAEAVSNWMARGTPIRLKADPEVTAALDERALEALFDMAYHTKHVGTIFRRVFGEE